MSEYPVGATWEAVDKNTGKKVVIFLEERNKTGFETWRWSQEYSDGARGGSDWATSYAMAKRDSEMFLYEDGYEKLPRFKRIK